MIEINKNGFTTLECVISLFIVSTIAFLITYTLHNNLQLIKESYNKKKMIYIAKEVIEDERNYIKHNDTNESYVKENVIDNFTVKTLVNPTEKYKCYKLDVKVLNNNKEIELNTYVTKKK